MGLDITAYSHLRPAGRHTDDWCEEKDHIRAFVYDSFPKSLRGIPVLGRSIGSHCDLIDGGCFAVTDATETHTFQAGSYIGYGEWREDLGRQFNPDTEPDEPFYELIWFADNEGTIGPEAARDLLVDFREHADVYTGDAYSCALYQDWMWACELAADNGLIRFH